MRPRRGTLEAPRPLRTENSSVRDHLDRADALSSSPEIKLSREAVDLKLQLNALLKRGADAGFSLEGWFSGTEVSRSTPMTEWRVLRTGESVIRVIETAARKREGEDIF